MECYKQIIKSMGIAVTGIFSIMGFAAVILAIPDPLQLYFEITGAVAIVALYLLIAQTRHAHPSDSVQEYHKQYSASMDY